MEVGSGTELNPCEIIQTISDSHVPIFGLGEGG